MQLENTIMITLAGSGLTLLVNAFAVGVAYGKLSAKIDKNGADIVGSQEELEKMEQGLQQQIADIHKKFVDDHGEPRLVSYPAHDIICHRQAQAIIGEFGHITKALDINSQAVKDLGIQVAAMTVVVAVLEKGEADKQPRQ